MVNVIHQPCPYCESSDAFNYDKDKNVYNCFKCNKKGRYSDLENTNKVIAYVDNNTSYVPKNLVDGKYLPLRGITQKTMEEFNVLTYGDQQEYVYPSGGKKVRILSEKKFFAKDGFKGDELFGMNMFTAGCAKKVTITEGELDALSVAQMLKSSYINPVVSLPSANPSKKLWDNCHDWLNSFDQIVLSVDNDEAGNSVADKIAKMFPNKVYRVDHSKYKDANEFLQNGAAAEFKSAWWNCKKYTPENVLNTTDQFLSLYRDTPEHQYVPTGIQALDDKIMGLMQGHFTVIKAPTGIGKTEVMRFLEYNMLKRGIPIAAWHLEETKLRTLLGLVSYELQDNLTRRDLIEEKKAEDLVVEAIKQLTKDELFYQFYLSDGQGADDLIDQIRFFSQAAGCKFVFFEPIQDVVAGTSEESKEQMLADLSVRLSKLAAELNVGIVTIAHTNDDGQTKYCRMIGQRASVILDLKREKDSDSLEERNTTYITIEKNRPCSEEGSAGMLRFNPETFTLREV